MLVGLTSLALWANPIYGSLSAAHSQALTTQQALRLFNQEVYGQPPLKLSIQSQVIKQGLLPELKAQYQEHQLDLFENKQRKRRLQLLIIQPIDLKPSSQKPMLLFLNKCGNQSLLKNPAITPSTHRELCPGAMSQAGWRQDFWSIKVPLQAGLSLVSLHESDIAPDDPTLFARQDPLRHLPGHSPGLISSWAWGLSTVMDYLQGQVAFAGRPVGLFGHSRRGKAALLAAARAHRFAWVLAHQTGTLGAVSVQDHPLESLEQITRMFPHWFTPSLRQYADQPDSLPVQQYQLLASIAPRPVLFSEGLWDRWASPHLSLQTARQAQASYDQTAEVLTYYAESPDPARLQGPLAHAVRFQYHGLEAGNWPVFIAFIRNGGFF